VEIDEGVATTLTPVTVTAGGVEVIAIFAEPEIFV
jgi:hypothetical protein